MAASKDETPGEALTRTVQRCIDEGAPVFVNEPADPNAYLPPVPETPAAVHLAEMRDLAERIAALDADDNGANAYEIASLAAELAELVRHYDPEGS